MLTYFFKTLFPSKNMSTPASTLIEACKSGTVDNVSRQLDVQTAEMLKAAMEGNNVPVLEHLINKFKNNQPTPWAADYVVTMLAMEKLEHFKLFYEADNAVNMAYLGHTGNVPGLAVMGQDSEMLKFLFKTGVDPNEAEVLHKPAFDFAISQGFSDIVGLMLDHGQKVKESNALANALEADKVDIMKLLVEKGGMDVNAPQKGGDDDASPVLHRAVAKGQTEMVRTLVQDLKADATIKDVNGRTALQIAEEKGDKTILGLLAGKN